MIRSEAFTILEIPSNSSKEDIKKAFKKKAAKFHPDVNKDSGAEEQFKKINEAWQLLDSGQESNVTNHSSQSYSSYQGININDFFDSFIGFQRQGRFNFPDIVLNQTITFKESVLGCTKELKYSRNIKCSSCNGHGKKTINNSCHACNGTGQVTKQQGMTIFVQECSVCSGKKVTEDCQPCKSEGYTTIEHNATVNLPSKILDGSTLNLGDRGHYVGSVMGMDSCTRVLLRMKVIPQDNLSLIGNDVFSSIKISLLEALEGCSKSIPTIDGNKEVKISSLTRNKEQVSIPNLGVERRGKQIIIVNVDYPQDISGLIKFLKEKS